jgi:hypothetical protein
MSKSICCYEIEASKPSKRTASAKQNCSRVASIVVVWFHTGLWEYVPVPMTWHIMHCVALGGEEKLVLMGCICISRHLCQPSVDPSSRGGRITASRMTWQPRICSGAIPVDLRLVDCVGEASCLHVVCGGGWTCEESEEV